MNIFSVQFGGRLRRALQLTVGLVCAAVALAGSRALAVQGISSNALQQIQSLLAEKATRTPAQLKMDSHLIYALKRSRNQPIAPGVTNLRLNIRQEADNRVWVDLDATVTPDLLNFITLSGGTVLNSYPQFRAVRALVSLSLAESLAGRPDVKFVRAAVQAITNTGSVTSEGDATHRADQARQTFGADGSGVNVGVLSDSVDYLASSQATGDLPADLVVLPGQSGVPGSGEGTAMLEIVHDLAPGAKLFFATAFGGQASFAQNIIDLRAAGCDIIIDDVYYFAESPFQDGIIAQAVNTVTADGALFFSSAGNSGNKNDGTSGTWEGDFVDGGAVGPPVDGKGGVLHSFGANNYNVCNAFGSATVLFWSDPLGGSTNDYDLYILNNTGANIVSSSTTVQNGTQDPYEIALPPAPGERVVVVKASGAPRFLHIDTIGGELEINTSGNIKGHTAATNAFSVGAVDANTSFPGPFSGGVANPVETFSSDGPRRVFFNSDGSAITPGDFSSAGGFVRQKPDIAAADGVVTTLPPNSGLNPFFGTSAAAPHAGAVAALLKSYNPHLTPAEIRAVLTGTALDIEAIGVDENSGYGIVMAFQALQAAPPPTPLPRLIVATNYISGGNGNGVIDFNECNDLTIVLTNIGRADATRVQVTLSTTTPGVAFGPRNSPYPDLPVGESGINLLPLTISTTPTFVCGTPVVLSLLVKSDQVTATNTLVLRTGSAGAPVRFDSTEVVLIPDNNTNGANSFITVSGFSNTINNVSLSVFINHTYDADLALELIGPDGTTVPLAANHGGSGNNYGVSCSPDTFRTTFSDSAVQSIGSGTPPFLGTFRPDSPLAAFVGKIGAEVNGLWSLHVVDSAALDTGAIQCWSLFLQSSECTDGGGTCPGVDLGLGLADNPDPVYLGGNLVYTISVTNNGPSSATNVVVNHTLPPSVIFVSAVSSQGGCTLSGGTVVCNVGDMPFASVVTITVTVAPTTPAIISSTAVVSSKGTELDPSNNSVTIYTRVSEPTSDLAVGLADLPDPAVVGGPLTYTVSLTNNGPSSASFVFVTNTLPLSVNVLSATPSQGSATIFGNVVVCNFGSLPVGARVTATIGVTPTAQGTIVATARAAALQVDPLPANSTATAVTTVGPSADLAVTLTDTPDPVVTGSNWTYRITVTNLGPNSASAAVLNATLPAGINIVSTNTTQGTLLKSGNTFTCNLGTLAAGNGAVVTIVVNSPNSGDFNATATATAAQADPNPANNTAAATTTVAPPNVTIVAAGATLTSESLSPPNGTVDIGETVTAQLRLRNAGNVNNTNLVATLLATGGVTSPSGPQNYGVLPGGGLPVGRPFTFTAAGTNGGTVTATLRLQDGLNDLGTAIFTFALPNVLTFPNTNLVLIPDSGAAAPYPSTVTVAGVTGLVGKVTATFSNFNHTFPHDVSALLVGPTGAKTLLLSHATDQGFAPPAPGFILVFDDSAASPLPASGSLGSGEWQPSAYLPAPVFFTNEPPATNPPPGPYVAALSVFAGSDPNGLWQLFVMDDAAGDQGSLAGGWSLSIHTISPVNQLVDVGLSASVVPSAALVAGNLTYNFTLTNFGPSTASGLAFTNILPVGVTLVSASSSQGVTTTNGNTVVCSVGSLSTGATATVTVIASPGVTGLLTNTATVVASETDLNPANNTASAITSVGMPVADVGAAKIGPTNAVLGSNVTFTVSVTNHGPQTALNVMAVDPLPPGMVFVSAIPSVGTATNSAGIVIASFGDLIADASATVTIVASTTGAGTLTNTASVVTASADTNAANNHASAEVTVNVPAPDIIPAGAALIAEGFLPPNLVVDFGETNTVSLALQNTGTADAVNLVATLLPTGGVNWPSGPQNYGTLSYGGAPVSRAFTFTAPTNGSVVTATLLWQDDTTNGLVTFDFYLPATGTFSNSTLVAIPDHGMAVPYPSTIVVSGLTGLVSKVTVTLDGLTHAFPDDVDVLFVGPNNRNVVLMSDAGGGYPVTNVTLTLDDAADSDLPNSSQINSGRYKPTNHELGDSFPPPAPGGPADSALSAFEGINPNGTWALYVVDDATGDAGTIAQGWSLTLETVVAVNPVADLAVTISDAPDPVYVGDALTYTIGVSNFGPATATGVMLTNWLPFGLNYVSSSSSQGTVGAVGSLVFGNLGDIALGAGAGLTIRTAPSLGIVLVNSVSVTANEPDPNLLNNTAQTSTFVNVPAAPQLSDVVVTNGQMQATLTGEPGLTYLLQASTNFTNWTAVATNTLPGSGKDRVTDTSAQDFGYRYYRAVRQIQ